MRNLLVIALVLALVSCNKSEPEPVNAEAKAAGAAEAKPKAGGVVLDATAQRNAGLEIAALQSASVNEIINATGELTVNEDQTWTVGAHIEGRVAEVFVKPGDLVKKGQDLAHLHGHDVHDSRANYRRATDELVRARSASLQAHRVRDRAARLLELKAASKQDVELTEGQLREADIAVKNAETELARVTTHLKEYLGVPVVDDGNEHSDDVPIRSPESGVVIERRVSTGGVVASGQDMFRVTDPSSLWMTANVAESDLEHLRAGQTVRVLVRAHPGRTFSGRILRLGEQLDPTTRTLKVRVLVPNTGGLLKPEMYATAEIERGASRSGLFVPEAAAQELNGTRIVFVRVAPDRFEARAIDVARTVNGLMEVLSGLNPGDQVVTKGSFVLKSQMLRGSLEEE